jgi:hypothetical protein
MDERRNGPGDIPTGERMRDVGTAMASRALQGATGDRGRDQSGAEGRLSEADVEALTEGWPKAPRNIVEQMLRQYGPPNEGTRYRLIWYYNGPWKRTEVTRDEIAHNFPAPHSDYITNWIDYPVPVDLATELTRYDGSCLIDRTAGEAGARCDSEAANFITLNFMHEIATGRKSVEEARGGRPDRQPFARHKPPAPYAEKLLFDPPGGATVDPDEAVLRPQLEQVKEKAKDLFFGRDRAG